MTDENLMAMCIITSILVKETKNRKKQLTSQIVFEKECFIF